MISYNTAVVLAGAGLLGANAGLVGSFAVLRRRALTSDALAHAALPGMCIAFLAVGVRSLPAMLLGAFLSGLIGIAIIAGLRRSTKVKEDAAIGIVLSVFFGAGVVLSRIIQNQSTEGSKAGLDSYILGKAAGMLAADVFAIAAISIASLLVVLLLYKEFKLILFDPDFARIEGWPTFALDLLLMGLLATTVVIGLPAVGVVLVAALVIVPPAAARFWTDRLSKMLAIAAAIGAGVGLVGAALSAAAESLPTGPMVVLAGAVVFGFSFLFAPRRGALARWRKDRGLERVLAEERILREVFERNEPELPNLRTFSARSLRSWQQSRRFPLERALKRLVETGDLLEVASRQYRLSPSGLARAREVTLGHRLRDLLLSEHPDWAPEMFQTPLDSGLERLSSSARSELESRLKEMGRWPAQVAEAAS